MNNSPRLSTKKKILFTAFCLLFFLVLFLLAAEIIVRAKGYRPWHKNDVNITIEPGHKFFEPHPSLGFIHIPGTFQVTLDTGLSFHVTHLSNALRITSPHDIPFPDPCRPEIWIFGCSFTHGWAVNDDQTFAWHLQQEFPDFHVVNFAIGGYGTIHALYQFHAALQSAPAPRIAILAYATFHDERNTFLRRRRKDVSTWNKLGNLIQPYARLDDQGNLHYDFADVDYTEFPLQRYSALAHYLEIQYNKLEKKRLNSHAVSRALVLEIQHLARQHGTAFILADILNGSSMRQFCTRNNILNLDINVDRSLPENTNLPYDAHPSPAAHKAYADKLAEFIRTHDLDKWSP